MINNLSFNFSQPICYTLQNCYDMCLSSCNSVIFSNLCIVIIVLYLVVYLLDAIIKNYEKNNFVDEINKINIWDGFSFGLFLSLMFVYTFYSENIIFFVVCILSFILISFLRDFVLKYEK